MVSSSTCEPGGQDACVSQSLVGEIRAVVKIGVAAL